MELREELKRNYFECTLKEEQKKYQENPKYQRFLYQANILQKRHTEELCTAAPFSQKVCFCRNADNAVCLRLALFLFMFGVFANYHDISFSANNFTFFTDFFYRRSYFHEYLPPIISLSIQFCLWLNHRVTFLK